MTTNKVIKLINMFDSGQNRLRDEDKIQGQTKEEANKAQKGCDVWDLPRKSPIVFRMLARSALGSLPKSM